MFWRILTLGALSLTLSTCQCIGRALATGSITDGVSIQANYPASGGRMNLLELAIQDHSSSAGNTTRWHIQGAAKVRAVRYGVVPPGMLEVSPPRSLEPGRTYQIIGSVESGSLLGPRCRVMGGFHVDEGGKVTDVPQQVTAERALRPRGREGIAIANRDYNDGVVMVFSILHRLPAASDPVRCNLRRRDCSLWPIHHAHSLQIDSAGNIDQERPVWSGTLA